MTNNPIKPESDYKVPCINIALESVGSDPGTVATKICGAFKGMYVHTIFDVVSSIRSDSFNGEAILFRNVTEGWAINFQRWAQHALGSSCTFKYIDAGNVEYSRTSDSIYGHPSFSGTIDELARRVDELSEECVDLQHSLEMEKMRNRDLSECLDRLHKDMRSIRNRCHSFEVAMAKKFASVRIDESDPNTYIVRPSALAEMQYLGSMTDEVITVVYQMLKPKPLRRLTAKISSTEPFNNKQEHPNTMLNSYAVNTADNGHLMRTIRKAAKPNFKGSLDGSRRMCSALEQYAYVFWDFNCVRTRHMNRKNGKHLRNSKFNW